MLRLLLAVLMLVAPVNMALASDHVTADPISATLAAENAAPAPGRAVMLAVDLKPEPGWHIYWSNPGDSGYAPGFTWTVPRASPWRR